MRALAATAALFGFASAAAAAPKGADTARPPYAQAYEPTTVDERGLWQQLDDAERQLRDSKFVILDPALNDYVRGVFCRTVGDERCRNVRIYVMRNPNFNATMAPNGMMEVYSGLLLRVRNEAELGAVLGHEFGHFELRHSLNGFKMKRISTDIAMWGTLLIAAGGNDPTRFQMGILSRIFAYNRNQEKEADLKGLEYLVSSPYPSAAAANVWERLMAEADATAAGRKQKAQHSYAAGFFADHPTELARAKYLRDAAGKAGDEGDPAAAAYRSALDKWLPAFLDDQIKLNDFGGSDYLLQQLAGDGWTPDLLYARAELYRQRANPRDLVSAAQFYQEAIDKGYAGAEARRGLGLALIRSQQGEQGRTALREYLRMKPDAPDASLISTLVAD
ncbi:MAG TPA: M48 family metalloprotease [Caulobacteraceae bacterium]|jgi:predicted Zn-dependent protease|nr:M48 family metalloprotease [Caulobacteraceae bacterium]